MKIQTLKYLNLVTYTLVLFCSICVTAQSDSIVYETQNIDYGKTLTRNYQLKQTGKYLVFENDHGKGVVDTNQTIIIDPIECEKFYIKPNGIIIKERNKKYGLYDLEGNVLLKSNYKSISYNETFEHYLVRIKDPLSNESREGIYEIGIGFSVKPVYIRIKYINDNFICLTLPTNKSTLVKIEENGKIDTTSFDFKYVHVDKEINGLLRARTELGQGLIDQEENVIIPMVYSMLSIFSKDYYTVTNDKDEYAIINAKNDTLVPFNRYKKIHYPYDKVFHIIENHKDKKGLISKDLKVIVDPEYDSIKKSGDQNLLKVEKNGLWGLIDYNGNVKVPILYDEVSIFIESELIEIVRMGKFGILTKNNKIILEPIYDEVQNRGDRGFFVKNEKYGLYDSNGKKVTNCVFDDIYWHGLDLGYVVKINENIFIIDSFGKCLKDCPPQTFLNKYDLK